LGFGKDYLYPPSNPELASKQDYLPEKHTFYEPKNSGYEKNFRTDQK